MPLLLQLQIRSLTTKVMALNGFSVSWMTQQLLVTRINLSEDGANISSSLNAKKKVDVCYLGPACQPSAGFHNKK